MTQDEAYEKYQEQLRVINDTYNCNCSSVGAVRRKIADGRIMVYEQCQRCGRSPKSLKKADFDVESLPWFNENLVEQHYKIRQAAFDIARSRYEGDMAKIRQEAEIVKQEQDNLWWAKYGEYLRSQPWHEIRKRVLDRDRNICQACLKNKATQVHHKSYELYNTIGRSAAFELVSICYLCHKLIHPHMAEAQHDVLSNQYSPFVIEVPQWMKE